LNLKKIISCAALLFVFFLFVSCSAPDSGTSPEATESAAVDDGNGTSETANEKPDTDGILSSFSATDLDGNAVDESIFSSSKLTMVNIWATFCGPCIGEMPDLGLLNEEYASDGFQVVGIVADVLNQDGSISDDQVNTAREIVSETGADYLHLLPSDDLIEAKLNTVYSVPETIFVDSKGNQIGESYIGSRSYDDWAAIIEFLLSEVE
jgi:thiol-disulfide isomerase/thioredoxin